MKLVMTLLVRNEDDILEDNISFHRDMGVDFFIAMDHLSTDGTTDILKRHEDQGYLLRLHQTAETYSQGQWVTEMAQRAYTQFEADWVINNDADEFWMPESGSLKTFFEELNPSIGKLHVNRLDFMYRPFGPSKFYEVLIFREWLCRWTKCCHRGASDVRVDIGNHNAYSHEISQKYGNEINLGAAIRILHYPIRSYERFKEKMQTGGQFVWNTPGLTPETSFHWKEANLKLQNGTFDDDFRTRIYGQDRLMYGLKDGSIVIDDALQRFFVNKNL